MFDNLGDDFPFDWFVKRFQKENIVGIFNHYSRNCLCPTLFFYKKVKFLADFIYVYLVNFYLKCYETKKEIKRSLHEFLGRFFALSTRLALVLFKIARLIVWWRYGGASVYIETDIIFIFLQKILTSLSSIAENLIIALTIGKTMCVCEIYFSQNGFYLAHFHDEYNQNPKNC